METQPRRVRLALAMPLNRLPSPKQFLRAAQQLVAAPRTIVANRRAVARRLHFTAIPGGRVLVFVAATAAVACQAKQKTSIVIPTAAVSRGDIAIRVQATGTVEPIDPVEIKSKAGGAVIEEPVEVGNIVKKGDLLAQVDPRDATNKFNQAMADDVVSAAALDRALRDRVRKDSLFKYRVITAAAIDSSKSSYTSAASDLLSKRASLDLARQALEDATVRAPIGGTIVSRPVTQGQVITAATAANGGTTLMSIADLGRVRMRVNIDEVEMGNIRPNLPASVAVDAFPNRTFEGVLEKIEPQAVVDQGVTFFPVLVSISNKDGLLMPGMNGEVTVRAADLSNVLQVPIDAIRPTNQLAAVSRMFNVPVDTLINQIRSDLVSTEGTTGIPGRYVVVARPDSTYEMRLIKTGPTDLKVAQVLQGLEEGEHVVLLGAVLAAKPTVAPPLVVADNMKRGAPYSRATQAGDIVKPAKEAKPGTRTGSSGRVSKP